MGGGQAAPPVPEAPPQEGGALAQKSSGTTLEAGYIFHSLQENNTLLDVNRWITGCVGGLAKRHDFLRGLFAPSASPLTPHRVLSLHAYAR